MNKSGSAASNQPSPSALPLELAEFSHYLEPLLKGASTPLAVATSGGADSMALLLLCDAYAKANGYSLTSLTVDHGLRPEAAIEAQQVARWCAARSIPHHTLKWSPPALHSAVQASAREARYALLAEYCQTQNIPFLLVAHHRDDQAETLFFRLARGSGLDGLACMPPARSLVKGVTLVRPLLAVPKERLLATLKAAKQEWIEDPSNHNPDYTRSHIRSLLAKTGKQAELSARAHAVCQSLLAFRNLLENKLAGELTDCITTLEGGQVQLKLSAFHALAPEYQKRAIVNISKTLAKHPYPPRTQKLERFHDSLLRAIAAGKNTRLTFAGCLFHIRPKQDVILIRTETARAS